MANEANCKGDEDHTSAAVREERESDAGDGNEGGHGHDVDYDLSEGPGEDADDEDAIVIACSAFGNFEHLNEHDGEDEEYKKESDEAEGFTHDGEDGVVDGFGEVAGGLDGVADADAGETAGADGEHGVVNMVGGVGTLGAG